MALTVKVKVPFVNQSFYSDSAKSQVKTKLASIYSTYKTEIDKASELSNVPASIITSVAFIESGGNPTVISGAGAVGIMQLVPAGASDCLVMENKKGRLNDGEKEILRKYLGDRLDKGILAMKFLGDKKTVNGKTSAVWITKEDLLNTEFNILVGTIFLGLLIDESTENGNVRLDKVIVRYNRGYFSDGKGTKLPASAEEIVNSDKYPKETKNYVTKFGGINGTLHLLKS
jgi:soluble lytic murein transglycosylase-like protein